MVRATKLGISMVFLGIFLAMSSWMHPFYVGVTNVRINKIQTEAQIEVRVFTDDIQEAFKAQGFDFSPRKRDSLALRKVQKILDKDVALFAKNKEGKWSKVPLELIGFEEESEATWFYLEAGHLPAKVQSWKFQNTLLFKEHPEQIHVVSAEIGPEYRKSEQLNVKRTQFEF